MQLFNTASRFDMEVQPSLVLLQKTLLNIEGLGRQLYPELDLWQTALPYLQRWNARRLSPMTLLNHMKEQFPDWVDQLPQLPALIVQAISRTDELASLTGNLIRFASSRSRREKRSARNRLGGYLALGLSALTLVSAISASLISVPVATLSWPGLASIFVFSLARAHTAIMTFYLDQVAWNEQGLAPAIALMQRPDKLLMQAG